ncbi:hypothetical protein, partial [uncultured Roseobacter sp.]|uniref:hypothetical protein n=1 Tax=uncultured Roseobacter sp. TaxID=114847 RepID=UPI00260969F0
MGQLVYMSASKSRRAHTSHSSRKHSTEVRQTAAQRDMCAFVVPHDPRWKTAFEDQAKAIE